MFWASTFTCKSVSYSHGAWLVFLGIFGRIMFLGCLELVQMTKASTGDKISNFPGTQNYHSFSLRPTPVVWILFWQQFFRLLLITILTESSNALELLSVSLFFIDETGKYKSTSDYFTFLKFCFPGIQKMFIGVLSMRVCWSMGNFQTSERRYFLFL